MFDRTLFEWIHGLAGASGFLDAAGIFVAQYLGYVAVLAAIILLAVFKGDWRRRSRSVALLALSVIIARGILTPLIKFFVDRPRPYEALGTESLLGPLTDSAFPSGHAAFFFALGTAILSISKRAGWWLLGIAFAIGIARIFVGVHWPMDIVGGAFLGIASALFAREVLKKG